MHSRVAELEREVTALRAELAYATAKSHGPSDSDGLIRLLGNRALLESLPDVVAVLDREHRILYINRPAAGRSVEEMMGRCMLDYVVESERASRREALERAWETATPQVVTSQTLRGFHWDNRIVPIVEHGVVTYMLTTAVDITAHEKVKQALRDSESRLRHAMKASGMGTWIRDANGLVWDDALCRILGVEPGHAPAGEDGFSECIHPEDRERVLEAVARSRRTGHFDDVDCRVLRPNGEIRHVLVKASLESDERGMLMRSYGAVFDITDRKSLEEQLRDSQKMDAIGRLTAGIAHNFNNVLGIVLPNVELAKRRAPPELQPRLDIIAQAAERGAEMVRHLMLFAREGGETGRSAVDLEHCLRTTVEMCRSAFDRRITLELTIEEPLPWVSGNTNQIEQALLNVLINARDALDESATVDPRISVHASAADGWVRFEIRDNGPGMEEATVAHIFEPFFTTRSPGKGTGLGLSSVYAIVTDMGGRVRCESRLGDGAAFQFELPACAQASPREQPSVPPPTEERRGAILVVDDEPLVRSVLRELLEFEGYRVHEAEDGIAALGLILAQRSQLTAVILDRSMPGVPGEEVLDRMKLEAPEVPVVMHSGHIGDRERFAHAAAILEKPVKAEELLGTLQRVARAAPRRSVD